MAQVNKKQVVAVVGSKLSGPSVNVNAMLFDKKKLRFKASIDYPEGPDTVTATLCSPNGKERLFANIDDVLRDVSKAAPGVNTINIIADVSTLTPENLSINVAAQRARELKYWTAAKLRQDGVVDKLNLQLSEISGWDRGTPGQQAVFARLTAEKVVAVEYQTYAQSEVTRLTPA